MFVWYFAKKSLLSFTVCEHFVNTHLHVTSQHKFNSMQTNFVMVYYVSTLYFSLVHELFHELHCNYYTVLASWVSYSRTYSWHLFISITHNNVHKQFMYRHELLMKVNKVGGNFFQSTVPFLESQSSYFHRITTFLCSYFCSFMLIALFHWLMKSQ